MKFYYLNSVHKCSYGPKFQRLICIISISWKVRSFCITIGSFTISFSFYYNYVKFNISFIKNHNHFLASIKKYSKEIEGAIVKKRVKKNSKGHISLFMIEGRNLNDVIWVIETSLNEISEIFITILFLKLQKIQILR